MCSVFLLCIPASLYHGTPMTLLQVPCLTEITGGGTDSALMLHGKWSLTAALNMEYRVYPLTLS